MATFFFVFIHKGEADIKVTVTPHKVLSDVEKVAEATGYKVQTIQKILDCESGDKQTARHINTNNTIDIGVAQINGIHIPEAQALGFDLTTRAGNLSFMVTLIKKNGLRDWSASEYCWNK